MSGIVKNSDWIECGGEHCLLRGSSAIGAGLGVWGESLSLELSVFTSKGRRIWPGMWKDGVGSGTTCAKASWLVVGLAFVAWV